MKGKTKNPLTKRIPRELIGDWRKYLVVSLFLILTIGFVSGMYVANESMLLALNSGAENFKLNLRKNLTRNLQKALRNPLKRKSKHL